MKNERWDKEAKSKDRLSFKDGQLEELRRRWEALPDSVEREEVKAQLTEWSQFQPAQPRNK
jgi:hypothetical protein